METFGGSCRLCLWKGDKMISLLTGRENIISKIRLCLPIQMDLSDNLPKEICYECNYKLEIFSEFYQTCIRSDKILKQYNSQIKKTVKPEIKPETSVELIDEDGCTSNECILNQNVQSLNSDMEGLESVRDGVINKGNTVPHQCYNELSAKNESTINKDKEISIKPSDSSIHSKNNYDCCYNVNSCKNVASLESNTLFETVNIKDSFNKNSVLFAKMVRNINDYAVENYASNKTNSCYLHDHTDMVECLHNPEKLSGNCDHVNYIQTRSGTSRESQVKQRSTYSNISMNCNQEINQEIIENSDTFQVLDSAGGNDNGLEHKSSSMKTVNDVASTHSDQNKERNSGLEDITCTQVNEDMNLCSNELITNDVIYSDKGKGSKNSCNKKVFRKYYVNIRNGKRTTRIHTRMKSDPKKGRRREKIKMKKNQNVGGVLVQKIYSCRDCNKKYSSLKWCLKHEQSHVKGRRYKCTLCNSSFLSVQQLNKHGCIELFRLIIKNDHTYCTKLENNGEMSSHTQTEKCEKCGKVFNSSHKLSVHSKKCLLKTNLRNKSNYKKKKISNKTQHRIKNYVCFKMKSTLRKIDEL